MSAWKIDEIEIEDHDKGHFYVVKLEWRWCPRDDSEPEAVEWNMLGYHLASIDDFGNEFELKFDRTHGWMYSPEFRDYYEAEIQEEVNALYEQEGTHVD